jgi:hypothetical protein
MSLDELVLLVGRELHHSMSIARVKSGEYASAYTEIGVAHVRPLDSIIHSERDATELAGLYRGHSHPNVPAVSSA